MSHFVNIEDLAIYLILKFYVTALRMIGELVRIDYGICQSTLTKTI